MLAEIDIKYLKDGEIKEFSIDDKTEWVKTLLDELSEGLDAGDFTPAIVKKGSHFKFTGTLTKKKTDKYKEFFVVHGHLDVSFPTLCISTGRPMVDTIDQDISFFVMLESARDQLRLQDEIDIWFEDQEYDLYFFNGSKMPFQEIIHEQLFLHRNPYPKAVPNELVEDFGED